jgi:hypothetical protein
METNIMKIELDLAFETTPATTDFMKLLQEVCEVFNLQIVGFIPEGPGGGWPAVTFRGEREDLLRMLTNWYMDGDSEEANSHFSEFAEVDSPLEFFVHRADSGKLEFFDLDGNLKN